MSHGVDVASNINEYHGYLMGIKATGAYSREPYHLQVPIVLKFWEPKPAGAPERLSRLVIELLYLYLYLLL
jgi:hypothetical protein